MGALGGGCTCFPWFSWSELEAQKQASEEANADAKKRPPNLSSSDRCMCALRRICVSSPWFSWFQIALLALSVWDWQDHAHCKQDAVAWSEEMLERRGPSWF